MRNSAEQSLREFLNNGENGEAGQLIQVPFDSLLTVSWQLSVHWTALWKYATPKDIMHTETITNISETLPVEVCSN